MLTGRLAGLVAGWLVGWLAGWLLGRRFTCKQRARALRFTRVSGVPRRAECWLAVWLRGRWFTCKQRARAPRFTRVSESVDPLVPGQPLEFWGAKSGNDRRPKWYRFWYENVPIRTLSKPILEGGTCWLASCSVGWDVKAPHHLGHEKHQTRVRLAKKSAENTYP